MSKILLIDEEISMQFATEILKLNGYHVLQAWHGEQGIEIAKKELPDLILVDIEMPEIGGLQVLKAIKSSAKTHKIKVVAIISRLMMGEINKRCPVGADDYLPKPYQYQDFINTVKRHCG